MNPLQGGWVILLTLAGAMVLAVVHLPESWPHWLGWLRPAWVALVIFYWVMELPHRIGLIAAWVLGALVDVLLGEPLGLNGALLAAITYVAWRFYERLRMYSVVQQAGVACLLVLGTELLRGVVLELTGDRPFNWALAGPALVSLVVWPFLVALLDGLKRRMQVQ